MKNWNAPVMQELNVNLTASSGHACTSEHTAAWWQAEHFTAGYDSSTYELGPTGQCVVAKKASTES